MLQLILPIVKTTLKTSWFVAYTFLVAVCIYATFYVMYLPTPEHVKLVHFQYRSDCERNINDALCSFPQGHVLLYDESKDIRDGIRILSRGQKYEINIELEMPLSEKNQNLGMFSSEITLIDDRNDGIRTSSRSAMLPYRSYTVRMLRNMLNILPLVFGMSTEKEMLSIRIFEDYQEISDRPAVSANVTVFAKHIQIYSANIRIKAVFTGIRYYMYQWPVTFSAIAFSSILWLVVIFFLWRAITKTLTSSQHERYFENNGDISEDSQTESAVEDINTEYKKTKTSSIKRKTKVSSSQVINNDVEGGNVVSSTNIIDHDKFE